MQTPVIILKRDSQGYDWKEFTLRSRLNNKMLNTSEKKETEEGWVDEEGRDCDRRVSGLAGKTKAAPSSPGTIPGKTKGLGDPEKFW